jgi:hypothetical protein
MKIMRQRRQTRPIAPIAMRAIGRLSTASFVTRTLLLGLVAIVISGIAHAIVQPGRDNSKEASDLVESIVAGEAHLDQVPVDFVGEMGYTPIPASGTLLNPFGGCSTPGEAGPDRFSEACQIHDLGYDLLRYAEMEGVRLGAKARLELDWKFYLDMLKTCETPTCSLTATAYYGGVSANSIRQGYKTPHAEPTTPWMALAASVFGLSIAGGLPAMKARIETETPHSRGTHFRRFSPS